MNYPYPYSYKKTYNKIYLFSFAFLLFAFIIPGQPAAEYYNASVSVNSALTSEIIIEMVNAARVQNNLPPLEISEHLSKSAELKAVDMLSRQYFSHVSPAGITPGAWLDSENYRYKKGGENLAINFNDPAKAMDAWLSSPAHRANILDPDFTEIGVSVIPASFNHRNTAIIVQYFGDPL